MRDNSAKPSTKHTAKYRAGIIAIVLLALAMGTVIQAAGWAQTSNYALIRALAGGTAQIDRYSWESRDTSFHNGHFYSVKAPGMALLALPVYGALTAAGAEGLSTQMAQNARDADALRWYRAGVSSSEYQPNLAQAKQTRARIENYTPLVWMLGLFVVVLPALLLMLVVRSLGEAVAPGYGTIAALATGAGTMILPFSTLFFSHVVAAAMAIGAMALLWRERAGPSRLPLIAAAGLVAGFAVTTEYPLALAGAVLGVYAITRDGWRDARALLRRGSAYTAGVVAGVLPLLLYNLMAFGSLTHFSYANAVAVQGESGHDVLGLNDGGFFGITTPTAGNAFDLLFSVKGLFIATPVLALAAAGLVLMHRSGRRAEAYTIGGIFMAYLAYNAGYWLPFGGGTPGPRFLIPVLPFLGVALAPAFARFTATGLALLIPSVLTMAAATVTLPMIGNGDVGLWVHLIEIGNYEQTIVSAFGVDNTLWGLTPFLLLLGGSLFLGVFATAPMRIVRDAPIAACAIVAWAIAASLAPLSPATVTPGPPHDFAPLIWAALIAALIVIAIGALVERGPWSRRTEPVAGSAVAGSPAS